MFARKAVEKDFEKDLEMNNPEVGGSVSDKCLRNNMITRH